MNKSPIEAGQPEQVTNNESTVGSQQVSPSIANAVLSAADFRKNVWEMLENLQKGKCFKSDVMDVIDAYYEAIKTNHTKPELLTFKNKNKCKKMNIGQKN